MPRKMTVSCSKCGKPLPVTVFESLNSDSAETLPMQIISGELFDAKCPHCKHVSHLEYDTLYHDMRHSAMVWVLHPNSPNYDIKLAELRSTNLLPYKTLRAVENMNALKEKASCLENGRDDRIVELCKVFTVYNLLAQKPDFAFRNAFYSAISGQETIYIYDENGDNLCSDLSSKTYDYISGLYLSSDFAKQFDNNYAIVDYDWAEQILIPLMEFEANRLLPVEEEKPLIRIGKNTNSSETTCSKCSSVLPGDSDFCKNYGEKKSITAPQGFATNNDAQKTEKSEKRVSNTKAMSVQQKIAHTKTSSKVGFWITIVLLVVALAISLFYNYSQYSQVKELKRIEENSDNYKKLLSAMENVNGMNYRIIGGLIDRLPTGYEDTSKIRTQYNELKKYISTIESSTLTTRSCDALRTAYVNLNSFNNKYHNWDVSDYLMNVIYSTHFKKLIFGREWTDGTYNLHWYEDGSGERLSTNLPNDKKSWKNYYFVSKKIENDHIIGYVNVDDTSDRFDAFKIVDVICSNGTWSISVYCYSNGHTYILK